jgi:glycosyltransferase involved in cell wall biosynthesis
VTQKDSKIDIKFSVIIPYYRQKTALINCLQALSAQLCDTEFELIVIYHAGEPEIIQLKKDYPTLEWIVNDQAPNPYVSRNLGARHAQGFYLCFIDCLCTPKPSWLYELDSFISLNPGAEVLAGRIEVLPKSDALGDQAHGMLYLNNQKNVAKKYGVPAGHLIIRNTLFGQQGGFETDTPTGNDIVFTRKLIEQGLQIYYVDTAVVDYPGHSLDTLEAKMSKYASGVAYHQKRSLEAILFGFLPMRLNLFHENLKYRRLDEISPIKKIRLWFLIWGLKLRFNLAVMQG